MVASVKPHWGAWYHERLRQYSTSDSAAPVLKSSPVLEILLRQYWRICYARTGGSGRIGSSGSGPGASP
eukprot:1174798-Rhodomonas_salina.2